MQAVDAIGVIPPVNESHVEMDLAWAMYEAWIKIQTGEVDTALVYAFGKSSAGVLRRTLSLQLEPYTMTPLWPDTVSLAGLQARAGMDAGLWDERAMAEVVHRSLTAAEKTDWAARRCAEALDLGGVDTAELHAPFSHQELVLRREAGLADDVTINPSGGALASNPMFSAGGIRVGEAARRIWAGESDKALAHATSGPALQQNFMCTLEVSTGSTTGGNR